MREAHVLAIGAATSLGGFLPAAAAARAGIGNAHALDLSHLAGAEGVTGAVGHAVAGIDRQLTGGPRLEALLGPAIADLREDVERRAVPLGKVGIYVAVPQSTFEGLDVAAVVGRTLGLSPVEARTLPGGRAGAARALEAAQNALAMGAIEQAVVGGCESKLDPRSLERAIASGRLKTADYPVGFMPGEAAVLVLFGRDSRAGTSLAIATAPAFALEEKCYSAGGPATGKALADVVTAALEGRIPSEATEAGTAWVDLNGEAYRATDWGMSLVRACRRVPVDRLALELPVLRFGDVGAAYPPLALALAARAYERGYASGPAALVCVSSDVGDRAAFVVHPR